MENRNKKGFTLIELLVVVLIIGILSSIALPQYQRSINKAKAAEAFLLMKSVAEGYNMEYQQNRKYSTTCNISSTSSSCSLDISFPKTKYWDITSSTTGTNTMSFTLTGPTKSSGTDSVSVKTTLTKGQVESQCCTGTKCSEFFGVAISTTCAAS